MDCSLCCSRTSYNPAFQIFSNYTDSFEELDRLARSSPRRHFRVGTGELADSLALDSITGLSTDLIDFVRDREHVTLELKTKTDEIANLLRIDPRGRAIISWTLSPDAVWRSSEHRTASPSARIAAARAVLEAGYRVGFHFDPIIAYENAERDYGLLIKELLGVVPAEKISFISMGALRMTPALRGAAETVSADAMLLGEYSEPTAACAHSARFASAFIGRCRPFREAARISVVSVHGGHRCISACLVPRQQTPPVGERLAIDKSDDRWRAQTARPQDSPPNDRGEQRQAGGAPADHPIGVFDSGIGGLTVLRAW